MMLPGVRTASKTSQATRPAASGASPSHFRDILRIGFLDPFGWLFGVDQGYGGPLAYFCFIESLFLQGVALGEAGVLG